jgi:hypothetical protein
MQENGYEQRRVFARSQRVWFPIAQIQHAAGHELLHPALGFELNGAFQTLNDHQAGGRMLLNHLAGRQHIAEDFKMIRSDER